MITYYVGRNACENTEIILPLCTEDDMWFHAENCSSCHVVALMPPNLNKKEKHQLIKIGARLCKHYTNKLRNEEEVAISYTRVRNVRPLPTPGMVSFNQGNSIII